MNLLMLATTVLLWLNISSPHSFFRDSTTISSPELQPVFDAYFALKDALVLSNPDLVNQKAKSLVDALKAVKMDKLTPQEHTQWMSIEADLKKDAQSIADAKDLDKQRAAFSALSPNMFHLLKASKPNDRVYYQHCPMYNDGKGAFWLSKDTGIKNPYYGATMLKCGKTVETIE